MEGSLYTQNVPSEESFPDYLQDSDSTQQILRGTLRASIASCPVKTCAACLLTNDAMILKVHGERCVTTKAEGTRPRVLCIYDDRFLMVREHVALCELLRDAVLCTALPRHDCRHHLCVCKVFPCLLQVRRVVKSSASFVCTIF